MKVTFVHHNDEEHSFEVESVGSVLLSDNLADVFRDTIHRGQDSPLRGRTPITAYSVGIGASAILIVDHTQVREIRFAP